MKTSRSHASIAVRAALVAGVTGLCLATAAQAGEAAAGTTRTLVVVNYDDLNLASPAGARTLYARLRSAAERACGGDPSGRTLQEQMDYQSCYESALDKAVRKVDSAGLQALHQDSKDSSVG
jgi:UrcA family protein